MNPTANPTTKPTTNLTANPTTDPTANPTANPTFFLEIQHFYLEKMDKGYCGANQLVRSVVTA